MTSKLVGVSFLSTATSTKTRSFLEGKYLQSETPSLKQSRIFYHKYRAFLNQQVDTLGKTGSLQTSSLDR